MLRIVIIALVFISTACTRYVQAPPQSPVVLRATTAAPTEPTKSLIERFVAFAPLGTCEAWGADSKVCHPTPTQLLWCSAPADAKPRCEMAIDWTPPPAPDVAPAGKAEFTKAVPAKAKSK